jgi:hypothetical protein
MFAVYPRILAAIDNQPGLHRQRLPGCDSTRALPRLSIVGHARKQPAQLDGGSELAALLERGADGSGICL